MHLRERLGSLESRLEASKAEVEKLEAKLSEQRQATGSTREEMEVRLRQTREQLEEKLAELGASDRKVKGLEDKLELESSACETLKQEIELAR